MELKQKEIVNHMVQEFVHKKLKYAVIQLTCVKTLLEYQKETIKPEEEPLWSAYLDCVQKEFLKDIEELRIKE